MSQQPLSSPRTEPLTACPLCGGVMKHAFSIPDRLIGVPGEFSYSRCVGCDSVVQNPMVMRDDLHLCYPPAYQAYDYNPELPDISFGVQPGGSIVTRLREWLRSEVVKTIRGERASIAGKLLAMSRTVRERAYFGLVPDACVPATEGTEYALEIGCGAGWFLRRLKKVGWVAEGIEWDETAARRASERSGCEVFSGDFRKLDIEKGKYSLIALNHVFEHLDDPIDALKHFHTLVKPGGRVVMVFPNPNSLDARWYGNFWYAWEAPRHLILPSAKAIRNAARAAGYGRVEVYTRVEVHQWKASKAYTLGLHPERVELDLGLTERMAVGLQSLLSKVGLKNGSETVVVLQKAV